MFGRLKDRLCDFEFFDILILGWDGNENMENIVFDIVKNVHNERKFFFLLARNPVFKKDNRHMVQYYVKKYSKELSHTLVRDNHFVL